MHWHKSCRSYGYQDYINPLRLLNQCSIRPQYGDLINQRFQYLNRIDLTWFSFIAESKYLALLIISKKRPLLVSVWSGGNIGFHPPAATNPMSTSVFSVIATSSATTAATKAPPRGVLHYYLENEMKRSFDLLHFQVVQDWPICHNFREIVLMSIWSGHIRSTCCKPRTSVPQQELLNWSGIPHFLIISG